jgi:hypothetical protein
MQNFELGMKADLARNYRKLSNYIRRPFESKELILDAHINLNRNVD